VVEIVNGGNEAWLPRLPAAAPVSMQAAEPVGTDDDSPPGAPEGER
jgi:hypothetical protein